MKNLIKMHLMVMMMTTMIKMMMMMIIRIKNLRKEKGVRKEVMEKIKNKSANNSDLSEFN